jgi:ribosomal protection tetracycline resistance protein
MLRRTLNLGILAHVDAGKTTLTERLLHAAGVIHELGNVDKGTTQTDTLALEQQRGITIKTAVATFAIGDVTVNLIDTPGHPDFIAEVERVLAVLDGAVLVVSAVEGVQAQTPLLWRALERLRVPTLFFVNKIDREGADPERVVAAIKERLTPAAVRVDGDLLSALAENDEALLAAYVDGGRVEEGQLRRALAAQARSGLVYPVFAGSALRDVGFEDLMAGIPELLPSQAGDDDGPLSGTVFKIERDDAGRKIAYARLFSGAIRVRDRLGDEKVTALAGFEGGSAVQRKIVRAGEIAKVWGLRDVRIGDPLGIPRETGRGNFPPPTLETAVRPVQDADKPALHLALTQLAEQDPLIDVRQDDERQEFALSLYGEVQKEVIAATLEADYGVAVTFGDTTPLCVERPRGIGEAVEVLNTENNPFPATLALRIEPAPDGAGETFRLEASSQTFPLYAYKTIDRFDEQMGEYVRLATRYGLTGWRVVDWVVSLTEFEYAGSDGPPSKRGPLIKPWEVRDLTALVLGQALQRAGTVVCEPVHRFELGFPADTLGNVYPALSRLGAVVRAPEVKGSWGTAAGVITAGRLLELQQQLRGLTRGEGVLESEFDRYEPVGAVLAHS